MALFLRKKTKKEQTVEARRKRRDDPRPANVREAIDSSQLLAAGLFLVLTLAVVLICFVGRSPAGPRQLPGQTARIRVIAELPFSYESKLQTARLMEQRERQVGPSYSINNTTYEQFAAQIDALDLALEEQIDGTLEALNEEERKVAIADFNRNFTLDHPLHINNEDLILLLQRSSPEQRERYLSEGKIILRDILREGIYQPNQVESANGDTEAFSSYEIFGRVRDSRLRSEEEAIRLLGINLAGLDVDIALSRALRRIFSKGLKPNLEYDEARTQARIKAALDKVKPVMVQVQPGDVITEPGTTITPQQIEMLNAYRKALQQSDKVILGFNATLAQHTILTLLLMIGALIYIQVAMPNFRKSNRRILLTALVLIINLLFIRIVSEISELSFFTRAPTLQATVGILSPVAVGAIVIAMLIGAHGAVLLSLLVATLYAMMEGNSMEVFLVSLLASLVGVYFCRDIRLRAKVVRAGAMTGVTVAIGALLFGLLHGFSFQTLAQQALTAVVVGFLTGMLAIGMLPLLEHIFKFTTDITLLELTDFNHPLLRKLQIEAPGTYHHSLMVANLSERAAAEIGANPLLCRATCLFHDIGKMSKPEYFVENQQEGRNPHDERNPTMSALIIKNHVKEGVDMAQKAKLPSVFIDIIQQHHGTTLIKYFFNKAFNQQQQATLPLGTSNTASSPGKVDESTFRYDGPRPRSRESAIIFIADSVEAASRSLKKVSPQSVEDLVDGIIADRIEDGQLDECPLTVSDIRKMRDSFVFTLLNMLHSRVEYPKMKKDGSNAPMPASSSQTQPPHAASGTTKPAVG